MQSLWAPFSLFPETETSGGAMALRGCHLPTSRSRNSLGSMTLPKTRQRRGSLFGAAARWPLGVGWGVAGERSFLFLTHHCFM